MVNEARIAKAMSDLLDSQETPNFAATAREYITDRMTPIHRYKLYQAVSTREAHSIHKELLTE
jgi:hypothetical protein